MYIYFCIYINVELHTFYPRGFEIKINNNKEKGKNKR